METNPSETIGKPYVLTTSKTTQWDVETRYSFYGHGIRYDIRRTASVMLPRPTRKPCVNPSTGCRHWKAMHQKQTCATYNYENANEPVPTVDLSFCYLFCGENKITK